MGTKIDPAPNDCYAAALPDEPMFVLLARDADAPMLVRDWADARGKRIRHGEKPPADWMLCMEARLLADAMVRWRIAEWPAARDREDQARVAPLSPKVSELLEAFHEKFCDEVPNLIEGRDFQAVYDLLEDALDAGARAQRGDYA